MNALDPDEIHFGPTQDRHVIRIVPFNNLGVPSWEVQIADSQGWKTVRETLNFPVALTVYSALCMVDAIMTSDPEFKEQP